MSKIFEIKNYGDVNPFSPAEIFYSFVIAFVLVVSIVLMVNLFLSSTFDDVDSRREKLTRYSLNLDLPSMAN